METFITVIHMITALLIILAVLLQGGNQGGMGAAFGGGNSSSTFGAAGSTSFLGKLTYLCAAVFMVTSIWLTILQGSGYDIGLTEDIEKLSQEESPTPTTKNTNTPPSKDTTNTEKNTTPPVPMPPAKTQ